MTDFWETAFAEKKLMWGREPTDSALLARDFFVAHGVHDVLLPGFGYGRNAVPFLDAGMSVTGIEVSETAIDLARTELGLDSTIHHGSVEKMPFDDRTYDGVFCYALIHLLNEAVRKKFIADCYRQLTDGGYMIFTLLSTKAPMFGEGRRLGENCFERLPGVPMYFYDEASTEREFGEFGIVDVARIGSPFALINVTCQK